VSTTIGYKKEKYKAMAFCRQPALVPKMKLLFVAQQNKLGQLKIMTFFFIALSTHTSNLSNLPFMKT
jgi:hypothetical protein